MAYIEWDYTVITSMVENQGWSLPDKNTEERNKFNDELGECMRKVGIVFEIYCDFIKVILKKMQSYSFKSRDL